jgi:nitrite reductase (NO-forming)
MPLLWIVAAAAATLRGLLVEVDRWLPVHLALLGAVSNVILVWSAHFTNAVLRTRDDGHAGQARRLAVFNVGAVLVIAGAVHDAFAVLGVGAALVALAVLAHTRWLLVSLRHSLPARFAPTVRYYVAAATMLIIGIGLGVALEAGAGGDSWAPRILVTHLTVNLLGWVSLTVIGTLVTLWPTMLRTPMGEGSESATFAALPSLLVAVTAAALGALLDWHIVAAVGTAAFLLVLIPTARPLAEQARRKRPRDFATLSVLTGSAWFVGGVAILSWTELRASSWDSVADTIGSVVLPILVIGFAIQIVLGALTYLVPVMVGGGPDAVRRSITRVQRGGRTRLTVANLAVLGIILGSRPDVHALCLATTAAVVLTDAAVLALATARARVPATTS